MNQISVLVEEYRQWLKDKTSLRKIGPLVEITTPFLDRHNDYIQIYAQEKDDSIILSDDGYTIEDLELSGCSLQTKSRKLFLKQTLNGFGVELNNSKLEVKATKGTFSISKHNLIQAILAIGDMFFTSKSIVTNFFIEDVESWMESKNIRFSSNISFSGKSGFFHHFDFLIPKSKKSSERIIKALNRPTTENAKLLAFAWTDTKQTRTSDSAAYAFLNDLERPPSQEVISALKNYDIQPIVWSKKDSFKEKLAA